MQRAARVRFTATFTGVYVFVMGSPQAPEICALYPLDISPLMLRAKLRTMFERNRDVTDVAILDVLLLKAYQEYQETMNVWKQVPHIMRWFAEEEVRFFVTYAGASYVPSPSNLQPNPRRSWTSSTRRATTVVALRTKACDRWRYSSPVYSQCSRRNTTLYTPSTHVSRYKKYCEAVLRAGCIWCWSGTASKILKCDGPNRDASSSWLPLLSSFRSSTSSRSST